MTITAQPHADRPDPSVIAAQNDAFRKLACLGVCIPSRRGDELE